MNKIKAVSIITLSIINFCWPRVIFLFHQALDKNQMENAKIFAENIIRNRKEAINLRRFGVKMGALAAKLESAHRTQEISTQIQ